MALSEVQQARNHLGVIARRHKDNPAAVEAARRDLAAAKLQDYITRTVDAAPELTAEQRTRLAAILQGGGRHA